MRKLLLLILILFCSFVKGDTIIGKCIRVSDGDTITVLADGNKIRVRLDGIDAPEKGQDFSKKASSYVYDLCQNKEVKVEVKGIDQYKRVLGVVYVDSINVNEELLKNGLAWRYKYNKNPHYLKLQEEAKAKKKGLWSAKNPIDPWQWRKDKRKSINKQ